MSLTVTVTPTQTELLKTLDEKLQNPKTYDTVEAKYKEILKRDVKIKATQEICQLNKHVKDIDDAFQKVGSDLLRFDQAEYRDENGEILRLSPPWKNHHRRFKDILEESRRNAVEASTHLEDYSQCILPEGGEIPPEELEQTRAELQRFQKTIDAKCTTAHDTEDNFKTLAEDVRAFYTIIECAVERAGAALPDELRSAQRRLALLQEQLDVVKKEIHDMGVTTVSYFAIGAAAAAAAIFTLSPVALAIAVGAVYEAIDAERGIPKSMQDAEVLEGQIQQCDTEIAQLMEKEDVLKEFHDSLGRTKEEVFTLADKVNVFTSIWRSLKVDMQKLEEYLTIISENPVSPTSQFQRKRFAGRLSCARHVYENLAACLEEYAKGSTEALESLSDD